MPFSRAGWRKLAAIYPQWKAVSIRRFGWHPRSSRNDEVPQNPRRRKTMKHRFAPIVALAMALSLSMTTALAADLTTKKALNLAVAKELAAAAAAHARSNNWNVVIAILDDGANLLYLERMDGVQIGSIEVARRKAESAIKFKRPSKVFSDGIASGRTALVMLPGALAIEGGLPIVHGGEVLGAIGISGVTSEQDGMIAQAAVDALPKIVGR
jgi:uncharacterized protein GlcG (DUF336 family)